METKDEILVAIGELRGAINTLSAIVTRHAQESTARHARGEARLNDHAQRLREQEETVARHLGGHSTTRTITLGSAGIVAAGLALWRYITGGGS